MGGLWNANSKHQIRNTQICQEENVKNQVMTLPWMARMDNTGHPRTYYHSCVSKMARVIICVAQCGTACKIHVAHRGKGFPSLRISVGLRPREIPRKTNTIPPSDEKSITLFSC